MNLKARLESGEVFLLDGAMGTELQRCGAGGRGESNLENPDAVIGIHRRYLDAGSHAVITNTLTMNRVFIETHGLHVDVREVNRAGARLARAAAGQAGYVLGNLSSTGQLLQPYGTGAEHDYVEAFKEQAECLGEGGVDGFIIETMFDLREAACALLACKAVSRLPVIVSIAFDTETHGGRTMMGDTAESCARRLAESGADGLGANCGGIDPEQMAEVVRVLASSTTVPLCAEPNAGRPRLVEGTTVFDMDPAAFAAGLMACVRAGARIVGGCCGTTPEHIAAFAALFRSAQGRDVPRA